MLRIAFLYSKAAKTPEMKAFNGLDLLEGQFEAHGLQDQYVAFEDRDKVDWKSFDLVTFSPLFSYAHDYEAVIEVIRRSIQMLASVSHGKSHKRVAISL